MRKYITDFFEEYGYETKDRITLALALEKIYENRASAERFLYLVKGYEDSAAFISDENISDVEYIAKHANIHLYTAVLTVCICLSKTLVKRLAALKIPKKVISNTLLDFSYKLRECKKVHGIVGTEHFTWYVRFLTLSLLGVGRLQFQLTTYRGSTYEKNGKCVKEGDKVLSVHIPNNNEKLEYSACNLAYRNAKKLFTSLLGCTDIPFVCSSWLLYPKNKEFLGEKSNIVRFMQRYDILFTENYRKDKNPAIPHLYSVKMNTPYEELPENTTLQKAYKEHLLNGGKMGYSYGIFFLESTPTS